ncbi:hypothetical protein EJ08DRAFT_399345 [Tothia fuscella]|uniref:Uncharacterized protein n=1 Tax=Tothia fuscella TaxID=1048955 RepID=A0A9P4NKR2_9PEZI|nr:hypothetical protein EJ08DRAFT_399345 [Tothia fuscella]
MKLDNGTKHMPTKAHRGSPGAHPPSLRRGRQGRRIRGAEVVGGGEGVGEEVEGRSCSQDEGCGGGGREEEGTEGSSRSLHEVRGWRVGCGDGGCGRGHAFWDFGGTFLQGGVLCVQVGWVDRGNIKNEFEFVTEIMERPVTC